MTHVCLLRCDRRYPERVPQRCTAYRPVAHGEDLGAPLTEGWTVDQDGYATCPSCNRIAAETTPTAATAAIPPG